MGSIEPWKFKAKIRYTDRLKKLQSQEIDNNEKLCFFTNFFAENPFTGEDVPIVFTKSSAVRLSLSFIKFVAECIKGFDR